jgi:hypothetical protein
MGEACGIRIRNDQISTQSQKKPLAMVGGFFAFFLSFLAFYLQSADKQTPEITSNQQN